MSKQKVSGISGRAPGKPRIGYKRVAPYMADIDLRTCHDVRKLVGCSYCKGMGDKTHMVPTGSGRAKEYLHGRCYIASEGMAAFLALPREVTDTLYLDDIGNKAMKALMARR